MDGHREVVRDVDVTTEDTEDQEVVAALLAHRGPSTVRELSLLPQLVGWSPDRLAVALGALWVDDQVTVDVEDAFLSMEDLEKATC